jgi:hypothetical protein
MRLIEAIRLGAGNNSIVYCDAPRLLAVATLSNIEQLAAERKVLATQFDDLCRRAEIPPFLRLERLSERPSLIVESSKPFDSDLDRRIADAHVEMLKFLPLHFTNSHDPAIDILLEQLGNERDPDQRAVHVDYLEVLTGRYFPPDPGISI